MRWFLTLALTLMFPAISAGGAEASTVKTSTVQGKKVVKCNDARKAVVYYRRVTHNWQRKRQARHLAGASPRARHHNCRHARRAAREWHARAIASHKSYKRWVKEQIQIRKDQATREARRLYSKWECIHRHEGAWNDPNAPYYGGLQMDIDFQRAYGPEFYRRYGTADHWPVWAQIQAAERAWRVRGFNPWPNTARACGLL